MIKGIVRLAFMLFCAVLTIAIGYFAILALWSVFSR